MKVADKPNWTGAGERVAVVRADASNQLGNDRAGFVVLREDVYSLDDQDLVTEDVDALVEAYGLNDIERQQIELIIRNRKVYQ